MKLNLAYFGTPDFSAHFLEKIIKDKDLPIDVKLVVTQPDKPVGKKQVITPSPVSLVAKKYNIQTFKSTKEKKDSKISIFCDLGTCGTSNIPATETGASHVRRGGANEVSEHAHKSKKYGIENQLSTKIKQHNIDLALLFAYGEIIPAQLLHTPRLGFWNVHLSLLPKYRGASPVAYSLLMGDLETGTTLTQMDELLDHGPIIAQQKIAIPPYIKRPELTLTLTDASFDLFKKTVLKLKIKNFKLEENERKKQNDQQATYTRRLTKHDGFLPFSTLKKAMNNEPLIFEDCPKIMKEYVANSNKAMKQCNNLTILNFFRGMYPWPGLWTTINIKGQEKRLKLLELDLDDNKLIVKKVQLEGKNAVDFETFNKAYQIFNCRL